MLAALSILAVAVAPEIGDPRTEGLAARVVNVLPRPGLFAGILLVSLAVRGSPGWGPTASVLTVLAVISLLLLILTIAVLLEAGYAGLGQRALFVCVYAWVGIVSVRLMSVRPGE